MKFQKRHVILSALILALGAAVYLNWQFSDAKNPLSVNTAKELGAATYVNADINASADEIANVSKNSTKADEYFAQALLERDQAQDKALEIANETLTLADSSDDARTKAVEQLSKLEDNIVKESNIESIIKAKGFSRCLCYISENSCTISVLKSELRDNSAIIIKDAVLAQLDIDFANITIIEV